MIKKILLVVFIYAINLTTIKSQCVGESGQVSWHYWKELPFYGIQYLYEDDTYSNGPDKVRALNSISSPLNYNDEYGSVIKGFISVPESENVSFNVTGDDIAYFLLSTDDTKGNLDTVAYTTSWTGSTEHNKYPEQTSEAIFLSPGVQYYFELHLREGGGGDHSTVYWQRPYVSETNWQLITSPFLTDVCDDVCPPKGTVCDDGSSSTSEDVEDGNCNCVGITNSNSIPVGARSDLQAYFYDDVSGGDINTLLTDPKFPSMPDRMIVNKQGLRAKWSDSYSDYGVFIQGYMTVPETGLYDFNVTGVSDVRFYLSSDETESNKTANMIETQWGTSPLDHDVDGFDGSQTMTGVNLVAGQYYYFEMIQNVGQWGHHFSIFWKGSLYDDDNWHYIPEVYVYDYTDELACLPLDSACDDGDPLTKNDRINASCECVGEQCTPLVDCDDPAGQFIAYDYCETTYELGNRPDDSWISCNPGDNPYVEARSGYHWIHYDLGEEYSLNQTHVWNYNVAGETDQGFENVQVDYSLDGLEWYNLGMFNWPLASGQAMYSGFTGPNFNGVPARYVMFTSTDDPSTCRGVSKINFSVEHCTEQGVTCDDNIASTINDHFNENCECVGYTLADLDCAVDTLFLSEPDLTPNEYHAIKSLISQGEVLDASDVNYRAGVEIVLNAGFEVEIGSMFTAEIAGCPTATLTIAKEEQVSKNLKKKIQPETSLDIYAIEERTEQTIRFFLPEPTEVKLNILDQKGNLIKHFVDVDYDSFGNYYKRLQTKKFDTGIYFVQLITKESTLTKKMVVL